MSNNLMPQDTAIALMQASQGNVSGVAKKLQVAASTSLDVKDIEKIEKTAQDFEAMFIAEMMKPMFQGIKTDGPFGGGRGEEVFRGLMLQEYGKMTAAKGTIGIADHVKAQMIKLQEQAHNVDATHHE